MSALEAALPALVTPAPLDLEAAVSVEGLTITAGAALRPLLDGVSFSIERGGTFAVVGAEGAGKSLLAACLLGQMPEGVASDGRILWPGRETDRARAVLLQGLATTRFDPRRPCSARFVDALATFRGMDKGAALHAAAKALADTGLRDSERYLAARPADLNAEQAARFQLALAIALNPALLICDEPFAGLGPSEQVEFARSLKAALDRHGFGMLLLTREPGAAAAFARDAILLDSGRVIAEGRPADFLRKPEAPGAARRMARAMLEARKALMAPRTVRADVVMRVQDLRLAAGEAFAQTGIAFDVVRDGAMALVTDPRTDGRLLARALAGIATPVAGRVVFNAIDLVTLAPHLRRDIRRRIGVVLPASETVFEPGVRLHHALADALSDMPATPGLDRETEIESRIAGAARIAGLSPDRLECPPEQLSPLERQRAQIARALLHDPEVLVVHEPGLGLPRDDEDTLVALLKALRPRLALITVTSDLLLAAELGNEIVVLQNGAVVEQGLSARIVADPQKPYTQILVDATLAFGPARRG